MPSAIMTPHKVNIQRATNVQDETGGFDKDEESYVNVYENVKCRIASVDAIRGVKDGGYPVEPMGGVEEYTNLMMSTKKLELGDFVVWGTRKFEVKRIYPVYEFQKLQHYTYFLQETRI